MRVGRMGVLGSLAALLAIAAAWPVQAAGIAEFKLANAVPADATVAIYGRNHTGRAFIDAQMQRIWRTVEAQNFGKELRMLVKGMYDADTGPLDEAERQQRNETFDAEWQRFDQLLKAVNWSTLFDREVAFGLKIGFPTPEFVVIGMGPPDKAAANYAGLDAILAALVSFAPEGKLVSTTQGEGDSVVRTISMGPDAPLPLSLMLARHKDALMLGFGQVMPEQALALLRGEPGQTLASTERFQTALKQLPSAADSITFVDMTRLLGQIRAVVDAAVAMAGAAAEDVDPQLKALPGKIIDALDMVDYIASTSNTDGMKATSEGIVLLLPGAESKPLYPVFFGNGTLKDPLKFIPDNAQNFSVWSGMNLKALYDAIINFVRDNVPNGPELVQEWEVNKATLPFDIEKDVLSWIGGSLTTFSTAGETAYKPGAWYMATNVTDEAKGQEEMARFFEWLGTFVQQQNGALRDADVSGATGFKTVVLPMLIMMANAGQPTLGIAEGQLIVGSGPKVISLALETARGEAPNFSKNERFQKEGLPIPADVWAASFGDLTKVGEQVGQALKMVPMLGMMQPQLAQNPVGRALISGASKLGTVIQEVNFLKSSSSVSTFDGKAVRIKSVTNYREPPPPQTQSAPAEQEESPATRPSSGGKP